jgi:phosphoribosylanthranilate isomerase
VRLTSEGLFIKISGVTSEADALFSIGLGATAVGFDFALTPRQISVSTAHDIVRRLPQGALSVGVFRSELPQRIVEIANTIGLSAVQIDGPASSDEVNYIAERVNTVLRMVPDGTERLGVTAGVDYLVLPEVDDPDVLADSLELFMESDPRIPVIASGGLNSSSVVDVVQNFPVFGVDVRAGVESAPGVKDPAMLGEFIANARWAYDNSYVERHFDEWHL